MQFRPPTPTSFDPYPLMLTLLRPLRPHPTSSSELCCPSQQPRPNSGMVLDPSHRQTHCCHLHPDPHLRPNRSQPGTVLHSCWTTVHASPPTLPPSGPRCCGLHLQVAPLPPVWTSGLCLNPPFV